MDANVDDQAGANIDANKIQVQKWMQTCSETLRQVRKSRRGVDELIFTCVAKTQEMERWSGVDVDANRERRE